MNNKKKVAVFLSGRGSNFEALYRYSRDHVDAAYTIERVFSDKCRAPGFLKAREWDIPTLHLSRRDFADAPSWEEAIVSRLKADGIELICLAGYMRLVGPVLLQAFPGAIINIHPSLLPAFPGLHAQRQALDYGVRFTGCTVHLVDGGMDTGPILDQAVVPVCPGDDEARLAARILVEEHRLYPQVLQAMALGLVSSRSVSSEAAE